MTPRRAVGRRADRIVPILDALAVRYPDARIALDFTTPWELLVATVLSAQSTDVMVNEVTPALFTRFPDPAAVLDEREPGEIETLIGRLGLFRNKAKAVRGIAAALVADHGGEVPSTMAELTALPGVGRKTASVVLGNAFGVQEGIVVDTHVGRLARRLGLTRHEDAVKVERDLLRICPPGRRLELADRLIFHGRQTCLARRPRCEVCVIERWCPSSGLTAVADR